MARKKELILFQKSSNYKKLTLKDLLYNKHISAKKRLLKLYIYLVFLVSIMLAVYVWQSTKMAEIKFRLKHLDQTITSLETNKAVLNAEIAKLEALPRIEKLAKEQLKMVNPVNIIYLKMPRNIFDQLYRGEHKF